MGKQKQQVISRFFAPRAKPNSDAPSSEPSSISPPSCPSPPPRIATTVSYPASSRFPRTLTPPSKRPRTTSSAPSPSFSPSLHQKFLSKLLDDPREPPAAAVESSAAQKYTPLEQPVVELKKKYPDVLLMVEVGYKYRFFGEDAEVAARVLGIFAHIDHSFLTASIPTFRLNVHVRRLVNAGYKVGVVKQAETAAIKAHGENKAGPFSRELSALYTKATVEAAEAIGGGEVGDGSGGGNFLMCVVERDLLCENGSFDTTVGVFAVEVSTGEVMFGEFNDGVTRSGLEAVLLSIAPAELLLGDPLSPQTKKLLLSYAGPASNIRVEHASRVCFEDGGALAEIMALCEDVGDDNSYATRGDKQGVIACSEGHIGIEGVLSMPELPVQALALVICHLKRFGLEKILCTGTSFQPLSTNIEMPLSSNALQQLEVLRNNFDDSESGSLLGLMNHTRTAFGGRLLKHWVTHPLRDKPSILARLDAVSEIADSMTVHGAACSADGLVQTTPFAIIKQIELSDHLESVLQALGRSPDVQRGITRILHRTATASEFIAVIFSLLSAGRQLQQFHLDDNIEEQTSVKSVLLRRLIATASSSCVTSHAVKLLSVLNKDAADKGDTESLFVTSAGQFPEISGRQTTVELLKQKLDTLIGQYRKQLGIRTLDYSSVSGTTYLIELPSDVRVPSNWVKLSSTKKLIRYHPPEVLAALDELTLAKVELLVTCKATWEDFLSKFGAYYAEFYAAVHALAVLDCLNSLAILSQNQGYVRPIFVEDDEPSQLHILSGRHPVLEAILQENFVPNDTCLHEAREYCQIVTGPNMGGKSCYIRQVALIALMAQVGSFVPAAAAKLHVLDAIYTRMGASDSIQHGSSTFFEELTEASYILHNSTCRSLVIIDELGRGTSTHDGVSIAFATLHNLLKKKCMVLFVTHYPEIADIKNEFPTAVGTYHMSYLTRPKSHEIANFAKLQSKTNHDREDVTFLYKIVPGLSERSFGLNVASLAQLPFVCIDRASIMAGMFEFIVRARGETNVSSGLVETQVQHNQENGLSVPCKATSSPKFSSIVSSVDKFELHVSEMERSCLKFFSYLQYALKDTMSNYTKAERALKDAQRIAEEILSASSS